MSIIHATNAYRLTDFGYGVELKRLSDGATGFFQGDDATLWRDNMDAIIGIELRHEWRAGNSLDKSFDCLCSGYDDVLEIVEA